VRTTSFRYTRPASLDEAVSALAGGGVVLAGGQSLVQTMKLRMASPEALVDINDVAELRGIESSGGGLRIGAMTRHHEVAGSEAVRAQFPWLADAASRIGDVQVRNRGTIGGNVCFADPRANLSPVLISLGAEVEVRGAAGDRRVPVEELFAGFRANSLAPGELVTAIHIPAWAEDTRGGYLEMARQPNGVPIVNAAMAAEPAGRIGIAVGGVAERPLRAAAVEAALNGADLGDSALIAEAVARFDRGDATPYGDIHGSAEYRLHIAKVLLRRLLDQSEES
jgi:aerobic carbon-monoxide dehydrogenase medium subunit